MNLAVCDDRPEELAEVMALLARWQAERHVTLHIRTFSNGMELLEAAEHERFSLYLLDVMMPGMDGIAVAREIRTFDESAEIVFLTSSPGFAYESYAVHALDYLLKPIPADLFFPLLDRLWRRAQKPLEALTVKCGTTLVRIPFSQLVYLEVRGKHLHFNLTDGTVREVVGSLNEYAPMLLARDEFMQPHRSYIVNMHQVAELSPTGVQTFWGQTLPVSRLLYSQLQKDYIALLFRRGEEAEA